MALIAILLGIVEGLTEFIPVSSTAHLLLAGKLLGLSSNTVFLEAISISIQSGAILAAVWYFWNTLWQHKPLILKVAFGFVPTAIAGLLLYPIIKPFFSNMLTIALALIIGGVILLFLKPVESNASEVQITYKQAFLLGLMQVFSFIPGVSRAGATLIGGTTLFIPRQVIVPFSFLLGIPTILGASFVEIRNVQGLATKEWYLIILAAVVAFIVARLTISFFIHFLTKKPLSWFGWYRIIVGVLVLIFLM